MMNVDRYLEDLESRITPEEEERLLQKWRAFCDGRSSEELFVPRRERCSEAKVEWPQISINECQKDFDAMLIGQMKGCSNALASGSGSLMAVRANYGVGILPSLFGADIAIMDEALNLLPTSRPLRGMEQIREVLDAGIPNLRSGLGGKVLDMTKRFAALGEKYPKIGKYVHVYHPDLQGPMDVCELLWGSDLFLDLIDHPDTVHALLNLICNTYVAFMQEWDEMLKRSNGYAPHWGFLHKGHIVLRDDSAMNLSPAMFDEFIKPYDQRLLDECGGGVIHFCGRGDHWIESASGLEGLYGVNLSQPHLNDMNRIFSNTVDKGIAIMRLHRDTAEKALEEGRDLRGLVSC